MLVLSQIENAKEDASAVPCDLSKELENTVQRMLPLAQKQQISIDLVVKDQGPVSYTHLDVYKRQG